MLIEFSVSNFRSIYEKQTLSMVAAKLTGKENTQTNIFTPEKYKNLPLLKTAAIYGANASGKSNLLKAMFFFEDFLLDSTNLKLNDKIAISPFRLFQKAEEEPTTFEIEIVAFDKIRYIYGFSIIESEVVEEHLISFTSSKPTEIFVRKKGESIKFSGVLKGHKKILEEQLQKNHLLLTKAANSNFEQLIPVYQFFYKKTRYNETEGSLPTLLKFIQDGKFHKKLVNLLKSIDTTIENFQVRFLEYKFGKKLEEAEQTKMFVIRKSSDLNNNELVEWELHEESDGTKKFFNFAYLIQTALEEGNVFIWDELNNSWHPHITEFVINLFNNADTNPQNAQLIFTTHDATLLNKDLLRRDQMWFVEKNKQGMSKLFSLADFDKKEVRWDIPFDKWYLSGRFGAIPNIQEFKLNVDEEPIPPK